MTVVPVAEVHASVGKATLRALAPREWFDPPDNGGMLPWAVVGTCSVTFYFGPNSRSPQRSKQLRAKVRLDSYEDEVPGEVLDAAFEQAREQMQASLAAHGVEHQIEFDIEPVDYPLVARYETPTWGFADPF